MATERPKPLGPLAETIMDFIKLPMEIGDEIIPELQREMHEMPEVLRLNRDYAIEKFKQIPNDLTGGIRESNPVMMMTRAASPVPILNPQEIQKELMKNAPRQASAETAPATPPPAPAEKK